jgi:hypothetical protein
LPFLESPVVVVVVAGSCGSTTWWFHWQIPMMALEESEEQREHHFLIGVVADLARVAVMSESCCGNDDGACPCTSAESCVERAV